MNLFWLDKDPATNARYHCDKHVVKMTVETAQVLSTVIHLHEGDTTGLYRKTHPHHPCTVWAAQSQDNFEEAIILLMCLGTEYTHRFDKIHKSMLLASPLMAAVQTVQSFPYSRPTTKPLAMPDEYKGTSTVASYRRYYNGEKAGMRKYTRRDVPAWFSGDCE